MRISAIAGVILVALSLPAIGQRLPKVPRVRVPGNAPGAQQLRQMNKSPRQAVGEARRAEVQELMQQALETDDPEEQARIYTRILLIDPDNTVAYNGRKDALARLEQQQAEQQQRQAQENAAVEESLNREIQRREALQKAEEAFTRDDIDTAQREIEIAKAVAPDDPEVQRMDGLIQDRAASRRRQWYLLMGLGTVAFIAFAVWLVFRLLHRDPYLEVVSGQHKGKKIPINKDLVKIGAVQEDGGDKNDIALPDVERMISRFHCEVHRRGPKLFLIDVGSSNGTFLGRKQIPPGKPFPLKRGSRFDLGGTCALRIGYERRKRK